MKPLARGHVLASAPGTALTPFSAWSLRQRDTPVSAPGWGTPGTWWVQSWDSTMAPLGDQPVLPLPPVPNST